MSSISKITNPLISVIMPAFNAEKTIKESIDSVLKQTYNKLELIIIDDYSNDSTPEIVQHISKLDSRIILLQNSKNLGVSETRNYGVSKASGDWIAFLDSDDLWAPEKLEKQVTVLLDEPSTDLIFTGSAFINYKGNYSMYQLRVPSQILYRTLLKQNLISCSSVLVRKVLLEEFKMKNDGMHEDYAVWLQILRAGNRAYGLDEPLLIYRLSRLSKSGNKRKAAKMTYRVYRYIGLNPLIATYYFFWYILKNVKKYRMIHNGFKYNNGE